MKIRQGFVSNSSSSSFIILLESLNAKQKEKIYNHTEIGRQIDEELKGDGLESVYEYYEQWGIKEDDFSIWMHTDMDNFDLKHFLLKEVGVENSDILMESDDYFWDDEIFDSEEYEQLKRSYKLKKLKNNIENEDG